MGLSPHTSQSLLRTLIWLGSPHTWHDNVSLLSNLAKLVSIKLNMADLSSRWFSEEDLLLLERVKENLVSVVHQKGDVLATPAWRGDNPVQHGVRRRHLLHSGTVFVLLFCVCLSVCIVSSVSNSKLFCMQAILQRWSNCEELCFSSRARFCTAGVWTRTVEVETRLVWTHHFYIISYR